MSKAYLALVPLLILNACGPSAPADPVKAAQAERAAMSVADPRLPTGFSIFTGGGGDVQELDFAEPSTGGKIFSFSVIAPPQNILRFYEEQSTAVGMAVDGRYNGGEVLSYEARKAEGEPKTFGVTATRKGEYTNVVLNFDVTR
ncbi:MAG: hypothetical protein ACKVOP_12705 [Sphingomonadaceae bacterium]